CMIASIDLTSSGFGAGTFAARSVAEKIGRDAGSWAGGAASVFWAVAIPMIVPAHKALIAIMRAMFLIQLLYSFRLLGNVQQHADAGQSYKQGRPAIRNQRQRNALGGHHSQHHADVDERL